MKKLFAMCALTLLAACVSTPYGQFDGSKTKAANLDEYEVVVVAINGQMTFDEDPLVDLKPGPYLLQVASTKPGRRGEVYYQPLALKVEACTRYRFVAVHHNRMRANDWILEARGVSRIPSCEKKMQAESAGR